MIQRGDRFHLAAWFKTGDVGSAKSLGCLWNMVCRNEHPGKNRNIEVVSGNLTRPLNMAIEIASCPIQNEFNLLNFHVMLVGTRG